MITHCAQCRINWGNLHSVEVGDEDYEVCPLCRNDKHLEPGTDITSYIMCPFTGKITEVGTGQELVIEKKLKPYPVSKARPAMTETKEAIAERELRAILAYQQTGNKEDYFNAFRS